MRDDAVAPVIAVMLILAAVATFFAIFNGIYIPSLKVSSETEHLRNVESAFRHFSSDIERAVSAGNNHMTMNEPVQLGGGDVFLNTLKSGGSLSVRQEPDPVYNITLYDASGAVMTTMNGTLVTISYNTAGNFWQEQGYSWQYGYLNVSKYGRKQTPLRYYNMTDVTNEFLANGSLAAFAGSFGDVEYSPNQSLFQNATPNPDNRFTFAPLPGNCSAVVLRAVNLTASPDHSFASGNGFGRLGLISSYESVSFEGVMFITVGSEGNPFGNASLKNWNESLTTAISDCESTIRFTPVAGYTSDSFYLYSLSQESPVMVTLEMVTVEIEVQ